MNRLQGLAVALLFPGIVGCAGTGGAGPSERETVGRYAPQGPCLPSGRSILGAGDACKPGHGRVIEREELERTGGFGIADSLRRLGP